MQVINSCTAQPDGSIKELQLCWPEQERSVIRGCRGQETAEEPDCELPTASGGRRGDSCVSGFYYGAHISHHYWCWPWFLAHIHYTQAAAFRYQPVQFDRTRFGSDVGSTSDLLRSSRSCRV
jgi:hypothetical protein